MKCDLCGKVISTKQKYYSLYHFGIRVGYGFYREKCFNEYWDGP